MVDENKCVGCGACASICPVGAITMINGKSSINKNICIHCGSCQAICPVSAIDINQANAVKKTEQNKTKKETTIKK